MKDVSDPETFDLKNYFPDFLWLLRDAILTFPSRFDGTLMTATDYLKKVVLKRGNSFQETENDRIGRAIITVFPTIECMTIHPPSVDPAVMQDIVALQDYLDPRFNKQVEHLVQYLLQKVRAKNGFVEGRLFDGPLLAAMASQLLEAVNDPNTIPCITDMWQAAVEIRCKKVLDQMAQEYTQEMEAKIAEVGLPMEEDSVDDQRTSKPCTLLGLHHSILLQKTEDLLKQVGHFVGGPTAMNEEGDTSMLSMESLVAKLEERTVLFEYISQGLSVQKKKVIGGILFNFAQRNHSESRSYCVTLFTELYLKNVHKGDGSYASKDFTKDLSTLQGEYYQRAIGPAKWEVYAEKEFIKSIATQSISAWHSKLSMFVCTNSILYSLKFREVKISCLT